ncbi:uncharacterized protein LOC106654365 [Trichogramma pretiosum]|uniref:uncharacterized protein LOC106654365 n=1 Tax=Trichogramma pretiosum TaxID=7493 RepID=UPI000C71AEB6|nr:uncharacterized protein LOC106654365 [Trichogramma pretiosum]
MQEKSRRHDRRSTKLKGGGEAGGGGGPGSSRGESHRPGRMTIAQHEAEDRSAGSSWGQQTTERGSWSQDDIEVGASSRRIQQHWLLVERSLYGEEDQLPRGPLLDECLQWREQLPHLRVVGFGDGRSPPVPAERPAEDRSPERQDDFNGLMGMLPPAENFYPDGESRYQGSDHFSQEASNHSTSAARPVNRRQAKEEVLDHLVDFVCKELAEIEEEKRLEAQEEAARCAQELDEFLTISPAPKSSDKVPLVGNNYHYSAAERTTSSTTKLPPTNGSPPPPPSSSRNKLGTVFNEKIIVSPVPYVATTRQSFSTLRRTPIQFLAAEQQDYYCGSNLLEISASKRGVGGNNTGGRPSLSVTRKTPLLQLPRGQQSSWLSPPVCPTVWPDNIKLSPIDTTRLPSSKSRSMGKPNDQNQSTAASARRHRNCLSPMDRSATHQPSSLSPPPSRACSCRNNRLDGLEIRGSHIVRSARRETTTATTPTSTKIKLARLKPTLESQ